MSAFLKSLPVKGFGGRCLSVWEAPSPPRFFVWGGKAIQNLVKYTVYNSRRCFPHNPIPSPLHSTHCIKHNTVLIDTGKGGGWGRWTSEKVRGALVHKRGRKCQVSWILNDMRVPTCRCGGHRGSPVLLDRRLGRQQGRTLVLDLLSQVNSAQIYFCMINTFLQRSLS